MESEDKPQSKGRLSMSNLIKKLPTRRSGKTQITDKEKDPKIDEQDTVFSESTQTLSAIAKNKSPEDVSHLATALAPSISESIAASIPEPVKKWQAGNNEVPYRDSYEDVEATERSPTVFLVSGEIPEGKIAKIVFEVVSHDQGWASEDGFADPFFGSYTWFEVYRVKQPGEKYEDEDIKFMLENKDEKGLFSKGYMLLRNYRARDRYELREVVWDTVGRPDVEKDEKDGKGSGVDFISSLQPKDKIAVLALAKFPGWRNYVKYISVKIELTQADEEVDNPTNAPKQSLNMTPGAIMSRIGDSASSIIPDALGSSISGGLASVKKSVKSPLSFIGNTSKSQSAQNLRSSSEIPRSPSTIAE